MKPSSLICIRLAILASFCPFLTNAAVEFNRPFAPQDGLVAKVEQPWRQEICLNGSWQFRGDDDTGVAGETAPEFTDWEKTPIKIPSPWNVNSFSMDLGEQGGDFVSYPSYPKSWESLRAAWMSKSVRVPRDWTGKRIVLHFGAVAGKMTVYVNGRRAGEGFDIFFAQEFDVTPFIKIGADNQILLKIISPKVFDKPGRYGRREYLSGSFWGTHIAGIWQDVFLLAQPQLSINDVFVQSWVDRDELCADVTLANYGNKMLAVEISGIVHEWINRAGKSIKQAPELNWHLAKHPSLDLAPQSIELAPGETRVVKLTARVDGKLKLWNPSEPNLYGMVLHVSQNGKIIDTKYQRFGWRQFTINGSELLLNGKPITLRGDSWHFMGVPQMTRRYAYAWYQLLKDAGANAVRLHASIYPAFYHDMADEMGIMILDESAIWLSDGGPKADSALFWRNCRSNVESLVRRDRNHPSVFGWSVCNEVLPVLRNVWHAPATMIDECLQEMSGWVTICRTNDPTRGWISGDGEFDAQGILPTINIHYSGEGELRRAEKSGKPWGVGETSMAYYGTPKQVSKFNGERAFESALGRMEGLAYECYNLLRDQQQFGGNYQSVFNIVWYGVQPLPLGKSDLSGPIQADEGIVFGSFREGVPGMQPERLGPYTSTLNPGYDPRLPLYRPWPMFDAIRDANLQIADSRWAKMPDSDLKQKSVSAKTNGTTALVFLPENGSRLVHQLSRAGAKTRTFAVNEKTDFLLLDASTDQTELVKEAVQQVLEDGGTIWVWDIQSNGVSMLNRLFGGGLSVFPRAASSLIVKQRDRLIEGFDNAELYFSESDDWELMSCSLGGEFLGGAKILLEACPADWRRWNYRPEPVKTAALFRSEREDRGPLAALVTKHVGRGRVILCSLTPDIRSPRKAELVRHMFQNEGIEILPTSDRGGFLDAEGRLVRALIIGGFAFTNVDQAYNGKMPAGEVRENGQSNGRRWNLKDADLDGVFDFNSNLIQGEKNNAVAYLAFWIKSPKPLDDLLSEPNLPKLAFTYGCDDGCELWLNGELLVSHQRTGPMDSKMFSQDPLLLKLGWNQIVIKVVQNSGEWKFAGRFTCSDVDFLSKLEFAGARADQTARAGNP